MTHTINMEFFFFRLNLLLVLSTDYWNTMSETIRRLASSSTYSALQDKISALKDSYAVFAIGGVIYLAF